MRKVKRALCLVAGLLLLAPFAAIGAVLLGGFFLTAALVVLVLGALATAAWLLDRATES